jgi:hypothetical protein
MRMGTSTGILDMNGNILLVGDKINVNGCTHSICEIGYSEFDKSFIIIIGNYLAQWFLTGKKVKEHNITKIV